MEICKMLVVSTAYLTEEERIECNRKEEVFTRPAPPADECARFLSYCENRRDRAAASRDRDFWHRLAGNVRKAATM